MAAAAPSPLASSVQKTNGAKLSRLLIDGGTMVFRKVFDRYHPPENLLSNLNANYHILNNLLRRRVLHKPQWDLLFPPGGATPDSNTFDITLLFLLLTNICGVSPPPSGWHTKPLPSDTSVEANLARIKCFRNELYGHVTTSGIDTPTFSALWLEISAVLVDLGLPQAEIDKLKAEHCGEGDFIDVLFEWADSEEDIKIQMKDIRQYQAKTGQTVDEVRQTQIQDRKIRLDSKRKLEEVHEVQTKTQHTVDEVRQTQLQDQKRIQYIKAMVEDAISMVEDALNFQSVAVTRKTIAEKSQTQLEDRETVEDSRVYTKSHEDVEVQREKKRENEILKKLAKIETVKNVRYHAEGTRLSIFSTVESWLNDRSSTNHVLAISGNAGMGKSVISAVVCEKMHEAGRLAGSHFCQHDKARHRNAKVMLQSLASQLCDLLPDYKKALVEKLSRNRGVEINNMEVKDLFEVLFEEPLTSLKDPGLTYLMVIDGLDESEFQGRNELLDVIANYFQGFPMWIRFLVTTRPELNIAENLKNLHPLQLDLNVEENLKDIAYMEYLQKEDLQGRVHTKCSPLLADDYLIKLTKKFEEEHEDCVRVLPYRKDCDQVEVCLYVYSGKSGILDDLKEAAEEVFTHKQVAVRCLDLYNKGSRVLKVKDLEYPSGKPGRLKGDQVDKISDIISKNLHVFSNYRNVTAVQPSLKITESKQTTESCITVYVLGKGHIPIGECEIPQTVGGYRVDVVDGFWYQADGKPWESREPNDSQKSFSHLRLGASIGVKGEKASGTLGAIVEDEKTRDKFYLLTCNHVVNGGKQPNIVHPALNDYLNVALWNLWFYMQRLKKVAPGPRAGEIDNLLAVLDDLDVLYDRDDLDEFEIQIRSMFDMVNEIEAQHIELITDNTTNPDEIVGFTDEKYKQPFRYYFPDDVGLRAKRVKALHNTKLPELDKYKHTFLHCLENPPRNVATFVKGIKSNVQLYDKKYYVDAAVAELNPDEVDALKDIGTIELVGTEYSPNGNCTTTDDIKKARELCKSGRTTGFTATQDLLRKWDDAPVYLRDNRIFRVSDDGLHDSLKLDRIQSRVNEPEKPFSQPCERSERGERYDPDKEWHYNCLCIPSEIYPPFAFYGDSGAVIFEKCDGGSVEPKCLSGFGVLFGVFETAHKSFALASPLEIVLKKLSQEVSVKCSLQLVSDFCE